jgi:hypothetical protein
MAKEGLGSGEGKRHYLAVGVKHQQLTQLQFVSAHLCFPPERDPWRDREFFQCLMLDNQPLSNVKKLTRVIRTQPAST